MWADQTIVQQIEQDLRLARVTVVKEAEDGFSADINFVLSFTQEQETIEIKNTEQSEPTLVSFQDGYALGLLDLLITILPEAPTQKLLTALKAKIDGA